MKECHTDICHADDAQNDYQKAQDNQDTASFGHEALAGGASFFAMHEFEKHQRAKGGWSTLCSACKTPY